MAHSELSSLGLGLTKEGSGEEEEAESRDMAEAERQLDGSPLGALSEASVGVLGAAVLTSAATFCCGGQEVASKLQADDTERSSVKSEPDRDASDRLFDSLLSICLIIIRPFFSVHVQCLRGHQQPVPAV